MLTMPDGFFDTVSRYLQTPMLFMACKHFYEYFKGVRKDVITKNWYSSKYPLFCDRIGIDRALTLGRLDEFFERKMPSAPMRVQHFFKCEFEYKVFAVHNDVLYFINNRMTVMRVVHAEPTRIENVELSGADDAVLNYFNANVFCDGKYIVFSEEVRDSTYAFRVLELSSRTWIFHRVYKFFASSSPFECDQVRVYRYDRRAIYAVMFLKNYYTRKTRLMRVLILSSGRMFRRIHYGVDFQEDQPLSSFYYPTLFCDERECIVSTCFRVWIFPTWVLDISRPRWKPFSMLIQIGRAPYPVDVTRVHDIIMISKMYRLQLLLLSSDHKVRATSRVIQLHSEPEHHEWPVLGYMNGVLSPCQDDFFCMPLREGLVASQEAVQQVAAALGAER